jgi:outer membrane protein TolC
VKPLPRLAACALAGSLAGVPAWAQPAASPPAPATEAAVAANSATATVTLRSALDVAWRRAIAAREADGQRRRADAERMATGRFWSAAPTLELSHRNDRLHGTAGGSETAVGIAMPLWLPGQRSARVAALEAEAVQTGIGEHVARLRLAGEVREAAWQVAGLQADARQAGAQVTLLQQLADDVDRRVRAGDLARADSLAAHAEALAASVALADARQRLQAAQTRWSLLTGLTVPPDLSHGAAPDTATADVATNPEWQLASQSTGLARKRLELVRHSRSDAPELTVGVRRDTPGRGEASQGSWVVGLRLPFGTDDRSRVLEATALSELDVAQTHEQRLRERLDSDIAAAREALRSARVQLEAETSRAQLLRERAGLIDKSFRAGETPLPDLLRALAAAAQADSAVARQTASLGLAHARLQQALGLLP